jgi:hypothetical protein
MARKPIILELTPAEAGMIETLAGFADAGEISGGPYDDDSPQKRSANIRVKDRLLDKLFLAVGKAA